MSAEQNEPVTLCLRGGIDRYVVVYQTAPDRAIIRFDGGILACVDRDPVSRVWDLSGEPARADETVFIAKNMQFTDATGVAVTKGVP